MNTLCQPWRDLESPEIRLAFSRRRIVPAENPKTSQNFYCMNFWLMKRAMRIVFPTFGRTQVNCDMSSLNGVSLVSLPPAVRELQINNEHDVDSNMQGTNLIETHKSTLSLLGNVCPEMATGIFIAVSINTKNSMQPLRRNNRTLLQNPERDANLFGTSFQKFLLHACDRRSCSHIRSKSAQVWV